MVMTLLYPRATLSTKFFPPQKQPTDRWPEKRGNVLAQLKILLVGRREAEVERDLGKVNARDFTVKKVNLVGFKVIGESPCQRLKTPKKGKHGHATKIKQKSGSVG